MIESVEQEVERLLDEDAMAAEVKYGTQERFSVIFLNSLLYRGVGKRQPRPQRL